MQDAEENAVRKATIFALLLVGCSHLARSHAESPPDSLVIDVAYPGDLTRVGPAVSPIDALWVAGVPAVESATSLPPVAPLCHGDDTDPPHVCPGTTPAPPLPPSSPSAD